MAEQNPYADVLADLERERDGLTSAINVIRRKMGLPPEGENTPTAAAQGSNANQSAETPRGNEINSDTFFGMRLPDAIRHYFNITKRPARPAVITKALLDGGFQTTAKDFPANVQTAITRMKGEVVKVPSGWALAEWFPGRNFDKVRKSDKPAASENGAE